MTPSFLRQFEFVSSDANQYEQRLEFRMLKVISRVKCHVVMSSVSACSKPKPRIKADYNAPLEGVVGLVSALTRVRVLWAVAGGCW